MNIQDPVRIPVRKVSAENVQEPGKDDHIDPVFLQGSQKRGLEGFLGAQLFFQQRAAGNSGFFRPLQCVSTRHIGNHQNNLSAGELPGMLSVQQGLQIGAAAGNQNGDSRLYQRLTFSFPSVMVPIT